METATVVTTPATWLPEDDILLKSAIEEGASLEALAKGAVPFSQTFTLQEIHDRWQGLLYDPVISAQAWAHLSLDESDKPKEITAKHKKRKVGTLRSRYHDRIKKLRNEFFSSADLGFLTETNLHSGTANGGDFHEQGILRDGPQVGNSMLGDCMPDPFGLRVTDFDILHQPFSQDLTGLAATNGVSNAGKAFHCEGRDLLVNNHFNETASNSCLRGFPVADSLFPLQDSLRIDGMPPFQQKNNECNDIPNSFLGNLAETGKCLLPGGELPNSSVYTMGFSPPLPSMSLWKTMEDEAAPSMPVNVVPGDKMQIAQDVPKNKRWDKQKGDNFINSACISVGNFVDLPESLFEFPNDDIFMDVDGKGAVDKSCCDNTLSRVPMDMGGIDTLKIGENIKVVADAVVATALEAVTSRNVVLGEDKPVSHAQVQMSSSSTWSNKPLEPMFCAFNTEDPDIPCNDDIFLLIHPDATDTTPAMTKSAVDPVSAKERNIVQGLNLVKKREELVQSSKHSMFGSYMLPETSQIYTGGGLPIRAELINPSRDLGSRRNAVANSVQCKSAKTGLPSVAEGNVNKDQQKVGSVAVEIPVILKELPRHIETGGVSLTLPEPEVNPSSSDQEGPESQNEDPHFSDIEAMVLDMDLCSYDDDLHFTRKVSKYQLEKSKKTIIRLEQCARASIQRAMTSQGAIAVLYSRRTRHFIRKKEVVLGRATEETVVDIDLGKEGRHNKISRRQAILKMEDDGSFSLKNLTKNSVLVNGVGVGLGELIALSSSCLIEIRGLSFMFESNQKYVKSYLQNIGRKKQVHMVGPELVQMAGSKCLTKQERI